MGLLFLVIMGAVLLNHGFTALGVTSIVVGLVLNRVGEKMWSIILGVILMVTPGWFAVGVLSLIVGLVLPPPSPTNRRYS